MVGLLLVHGLSLAGPWPGRGWAMAEPRMGYGWAVTGPWLGCGGLWLGHGGPWLGRGSQVHGVCSHTARGRWWPWRHKAAGNARNHLLTTWGGLGDVAGVSGGFLRGMWLPRISVARATDSENRSDGPPDTTLPMSTQGCRTHPEAPRMAPGGCWGEPCRFLAGLVGYVTSSGFGCKSHGLRT